MTSCQANHQHTWTVHIHVPVMSCTLYVWDVFYKKCSFLLNVVKTLEIRKFPSISVVGLRVSPIPLAAVIVSLNTSGSGEGSPIPLVVVMVSLNTSGSGEGSPIPLVVVMVSLNTSGSGEGSPIPLVAVMVSLNTSGSGEGFPQYQRWRWWFLLIPDHLLYSSKWSLSFLLHFL